MSWTYTLRVVFFRASIEGDGIERWTSGGWEMDYGTIEGPVERGAYQEHELKSRRVYPTRCVIPLTGLVRMLLLGPDQGY